LGWSSWMVEHTGTSTSTAVFDDDDAILGMVFEPERSLAMSANAAAQAPQTQPMRHET